MHDLHRPVVLVTAAKFSTLAKVSCGACSWFVPL